MAYVAPHTFDLSTAELPSTGSWNGSVLSGDGGWLYFIFTDLILDPATTYEFQMDIGPDGVGPYSSSQINTYSQLDPPATAADALANSDWYDLASAVAPLDDGSAQTVTLTMGPGLGSWDTKPAGENRLLFEFGSPHMVVTGLRLTAGATVGDTAGPRRSGFGLVLDSSAVVNVTPPLDTLTATVPLHVIGPTVPVPTLVNGRPA